MTRPFAGQPDENPAEAKHSFQRLHCFFVTDTVLCEALLSPSLIAARRLMKVWDGAEEGRGVGQSGQETLGRKRAEIRSDWEAVERRECLRKAPEERDDLKQTLKSRSGSMKWVPMEVRGCSGRAVWIRSRRTGGAFGRLGPPWNDEVEMLPNEHYKGIPALQEWGQTQETLCVGKCEKCEKCEKCACSPRWRSKDVPGTLP